MLATASRPRSWSGCARSETRTRSGCCWACRKLTLPAAYIALLVLIVAGAWAGIEIGAFTSGQMWLWAAVVVLVVIFVAMYAS